MDGGTDRQVDKVIPVESPKLHFRGYNDFQIYSYAKLEPLFSGTRAYGLNKFDSLSYKETFIEVGAFLVQLSLKRPTLF